MAYLVLARKYRSASFDDVIGQDHVAQTLKKAIESDRVAHAYLFCGTRGVGKTSMARIVAKALNCEKSKGPTTEPCGKCESCKAIARGDDIDVIEIDAASNTGVDNVRDVIENSAYRPTRSRFKIYIIDEVHMLSKAAFNALLKTLEEPPEHVKFILATTEPEKVLPTILSRCQRYDFRNIPAREIANHLKNICKEEKISADDDALLLVGKAGVGSMRDSLSLLDRLLSVGEKKVTVATVENLLGLPKAQLMFDLAEAIGESDTKKTLSMADKLITSGLAADSLIGALVDHLRNLLIVRTCGIDSGLVEVPGLSPDDLDKQAAQFDPAVLTQDITILEELRRQMRGSMAGRALLDATLVRLALADQFSSVAQLLDRVDGNATASSAAPAVQKKKSEPVEAAPAEETPAVLIPDSSGDTDTDDLPSVGKVWEGEKVSLSKAFARHRAPQSSPPSPERAEPSPVASNFEPVDLTNLPAVWQAMLNLLSEKKLGLHALTQAQFVGMQEGKAVIRFHRMHETFVRNYERNGRKDQIRDALSSVMGQSVGILFEIDDANGSSEPQSSAGAASAASAASAAAASPATAATPLRAQAPRLTTEQKEALAQDELVRAVMVELNAEIIRVSEE